MKTIIGILLGALVFLISCDDQKDGPWAYPPISSTMLDLLFVDEAGNYLVKNLPLMPIPPHMYNYIYADVDSTSYCLSVIINGQIFDKEEQWPCEASLVNGRFHLVTNANMVGGPNYEGTPDAIYVYEITFSCPGIYGDESEHTFVLERKRRYYGWTNNAERLLYDGKVIASGEEGARPPGPETPFVIVVPQK